MMRGRRFGLQPPQSHSKHDQSVIGAAVSICMFACLFVRLFGSCFELGSDKDSDPESFLGENYRQSLQAEAALVWSILILMPFPARMYLPSWIRRNWR